MKVRIGVGAPGTGLDGPALGRLGAHVAGLGFDSLWLPEVLTRPGLDPLVGLSWAGALAPRLKLGTTMLLPGRNPVRLAGQIAALDALSGGRLLVTFVPGLTSGPERDAVGVQPSERGASMDELLPLLRRLWTGEPVSHHGPAAHFTGVSVTPRPAQEPLEVWVGGVARASLERCGRLADGWLPAMCSPADAERGREVVEAAAAAAGRTISPEHFGVSVAYARAPLDDQTAAALSVRSRGRPLEDLVPVGLDALRELLLRYIAVGFSKFVVRVLVPPGDPQAELAELDDLFGAVGSLQTS